MRYLTVGEVVALHRAILESSGGATGVRDLGALESALAQPRASFGGVDLHTSLPAKAAALGFSLALNIRSLTAISGSPMLRWKPS
jgi:death-on-curing protein